MAVKCKELIYTPVNALTFRISGCTETLIPIKEKGIITTLKSSDPKGIQFNKGLTLEINKRKYKIGVIEEKIVGKNTYYDVSIAKRTKSSIFVMPMLTGNRNLFFWNRLFVNCFISTGEDENCIALLYRWSSDPLYVKFEKALSKFRTFKRRYDPSPNYVMFVFDVPKKYKKDYKLFLSGGYSKFSKSYKLKILEFHNLDIYSEAGQILFKHKNRKKALETKLGCKLPKDSELLSIITESNETYNTETYKFKKLI